MLLYAIISLTYHHALNEKQKRLVRFTIVNFSTWRFYSVYGEPKVYMHYAFYAVHAELSCFFPIEIRFEFKDNFLFLGTLKLL